MGKYLYVLSLSTHLHNNILPCQPSYSLNYHQYMDHQTMYFRTRLCTKLSAHDMKNEGLPMRLYQYMWNYSRSKQNRCRIGIQMDIPWYNFHLQQDHRSHTLKIQWFVKLHVGIYISEHS